MTCDCEMSWMKNFGPLSGSVTCSSPSQAAGQTINSLTYQDLGCGKSHYITCYSLLGNYAKQPLSSLKYEMIRSALV